MDEKNWVKRDGGEAGELSGADRTGATLNFITSQRRDSVSGMFGKTRGRTGWSLNKAGLCSLDLTSNVQTGVSHGNIMSLRDIGLEFYIFPTFCPPGSGQFPHPAVSTVSRTTIEEFPYLWFASQAGPSPDGNHGKTRLRGHKLQHGRQGGPVRRRRSLFLKDQSLEVKQAKTMSSCFQSHSCPLKLRLT